MGLFGVIGKMAGSKVLGKVEEELTKKQNREQTIKYCNYINNNMPRVCKLITDLEDETKTLIDTISSMKSVKISFKEKGNLRKIKAKADKNLQYLYLARDFFTALAKNISGIVLSNEELMLVSKFAPFFDGVPVLDIDEETDDSLLGSFKEIEQELREAFVSSKKSSTYFDFEDYLSRYDEKIEDLIVPDINSSIESFQKAMSAQDTATMSAENQNSVVCTPVTELSD